MTKRLELVICALANQTGERLQLSTITIGHGGRYDEGDHHSPLVGSLGNGRIYPMLLWGVSVEKCDMAYRRD